MFPRTQRPIWGAVVVSFAAWRPLLSRSQAALEVRHEEVGNLEGVVFHDHVRFPLPLLETGRPEK